MQIERFQELVARLERESARAPGVYRAKVAALALLGFGILALLLGAVGFGLLVLVAVAAAVAFSGGTALLLLLKLGKLLVFLALPLWFMVRNGVRALFVRLPAPQGREVTPHEAPQLFAALDRMRRQMKGPRFHRVLLIDEVNAAVVQRPAFGLVGWPRNYLLLGLPLLEALPADEALAVVAHEYGHLAGSHGRFSAFIYRLRLTWGTLQDQADQVQGWLGKLVAPLVRWYAPYFNAYTFVLARADEYAADAASADLVGAGAAASALKRVNLITPRHQAFMQETFDRIDHDPRPPADLMQRWAATATTSPADDEARRWLAEALDREGQVMDTHPTLRARLAALVPPGPALEAAPTAASGPSAAEAWFGGMLPLLRSEFQSRWAEGVAQPWAERHDELRQERARLADLRVMPARDAEAEIEMLRLALRHEPQHDWREALAAFNAAHPDHALGLFLEGTARLDKDDAAGLALLERVIALDPAATKPACAQAHAFLLRRQDRAAAEAFAERWRQRDEMETLRARQLQEITGRDELVAHGLGPDEVQAVIARLDGSARQHVSRLHLARRIVPADPTARQWLLGVELTWWGRQRSKQQEVVDRLAALEWPVPLVVLTLEGAYAGLRTKFMALPGARLV